LTVSHWVSCFRVKEVICFGEGAGANILARFAVRIVRFLLIINYQLKNKEYLKYKTKIFVN